MLIDCDTCLMRHTSACDECVVTLLCDGMGRVELDDGERRALENLAEVGLCPPLRLVRDEDLADREAG